MSVRQIAYCAVTVALLIAVQYSLSFISGVELTTVLLLCFCYVFGVKCGVTTATAFSLVRCLVFGFTPSVIVLYLVYYNLFAVLFGVAGKGRIPAWLPPVLLGLIAAACLYFAIAGVPISLLYERRVRIMLWVLFGITAALIIAYAVLLFSGKTKSGREVAAVTALAAFCTVCFTLLDDIITPLFYGYSAGVATAYFYTGFLAMLPQTICAAVSVSILFYPLKKLLTYFYGNKKDRKI